LQLDKYDKAMKRWGSVVLFVCVFAGVPLPAQTKLVVESSERRPLESAALLLARAGRGNAWRDVVRVLIELGLKGKRLDKHRETGGRYLSRSKPGASVKQAVRKLHSAMVRLDGALSRLPAEQQQRCASLLLQLDGSLPEAHSVLGHEPVDGGWALAGESRRSQRRVDMARAIEAVHKIELDVETGQSQQPQLRSALGRPGTVAKCAGLSFHSAYSEVKSARIVQQTLRLAAFVNFLQTGVVAVPDYGQQVSVLLPSPASYRAAVQELRDQAVVDAVEASAAMRCNAWRFAGSMHLSSLAMEVDQVVVWCATLEYWRGRYPCLTAGRVDLACRLVIGQPMPPMTEIVEVESGMGATLAGDSEARLERERYLLLAQAGMQGSRKWLRYLVRRNEAPSWRSTMHDQVGSIQGDELLKASSMVQFLSEEGRFAGLEQRAGNTGKQDQGAALAAGLGESLEQLEVRWRKWVIGVDQGLVQRLGQGTIEPDPEVTAAIAQVRAIRAGASLHVPVEIDSDLSDGCDAHARYLGRHRDQTERWPDCHEEYPDREGWSVVGVQAGKASVVASGIKSEQQALDAWMATFYHRLPLLDPGLRRIGYARVRDVAVLDCGSMVDPMLEADDVVVVWPPDGMTNVPNRFEPEMPNPVPGSDQREFGYPITLQHTKRSSLLPVDLLMEVREGGAHGSLVDCHYSTPGKPTNPLLAPPKAFCLIPKSPLKSGVTYWVRAVFMGEGKEMTWSFRTM